MTKIKLPLRVIDTKSMKLFNKSDLKLFLISAAIIAACLIGCYLLTDNSRADPLEVQNSNYQAITHARNEADGIGGGTAPAALRRHYQPGFICPVPPDDSRAVTSFYGTRESPRTGIIQDHKAVDMVGAPHSMILASCTGYVWAIGYNSVDGKYITILHGDGYRTKYCHLSKIYVNAGTNVQTGECIGRMGDTGHSTGEHLHFEIWQYGAALDPLQVLGISLDGERRF